MTTEQLKEIYLDQKAAFITKEKSRDCLRLLMILICHTDFL